MHTMYHTLYHFLPPYGKAARMAQRVVNLLLVQDVKCAGHYAAVLRNDGKHYGLNKPLCDYDGTPLPWGATFGCLGTLLADAEPIVDMKLGNTDCLAHVFCLGDRYGFVTYATNVRDLDVHCRPAERELPGMSFPCPDGSVEVLDMYWNPRTDARWEKGILELDLNEEPTFVLDKTLARGGLVKMIAAGKRAPRVCDMTMAFVRAEKGQDVGVEVRLRNNSAKELKDVFLDLRPAGNDERTWSVSGDWLLRTPYASVGTVPAGGERAVRLPTVLDGKTPYEDGQMRLNLFADGDQVQLASDQSLWLVPAVRVQAHNDGTLDEWENRPAAWLAYQWDSMPMASLRSQLYEGVEHFSYPPYRLDARAMFWVGYDDTGLIVGVRLEDDQPVLSAEKGETVRVVLGAEGRLTSLDLRPLADGKVEVASSAAEGGTVEARGRQVQETISNGADLKPTPIRPVLIEAAIPWKLVGLEPRPGDVVGFDLFWTDVDKEGDRLAEGTLRWAGGARESGYLLLSTDGLRTADK